jgi:heat shock protein HslJ
MKKFFPVFLGILMLSVFLAGCTSQTATPTPVPTQSPVTQFSIVGVWDLVSYNTGAGGMASVIAGSETNANFGADGKVAGSAGCNQYSAGYTTTTSNGITIGQPTTTLMACESNLMQQETQYLSLLQKAAKYGISADQLTLSDVSGTQILIFKKHVSTPITGSWILFSYNNGKGAIQSVTSGGVTTAVFGSDNKLTGSGGCNQYSAVYKASGQNVTISQSTSTMMACKDNIMQQETQYFSLLPTAATYETAGDQLTLYNTTGTKILIYKTAGLKVNPL